MTAISRRGFVGLGGTVAAGMAISPWTRGGWGSSEVFEYTSVLRFPETWTSSLGKPAACPDISTWRRKASGDLTGVFDLADPAYGSVPLPATSVIGHSTCGPLCNPVPTNNALRVQETGTRPARALPYQPCGYLDHLEFGSSGKILARFTMSNQGRLLQHRYGLRQWQVRPQHDRPQPLPAPLPG